jgi:PKD repeat protein
MQRARVLAVVGAILALTISPTATLAAAPSNDDPATATVIAALPSTASVDLSQATNESPPFPACESIATQRVWFAYTPASDATLAVSVGHDPIVELALWTVGAGPTDLSLAGCSIDGLDLVKSLVAGTTYLVSVGMWEPGSPFAGTVTFTQPVPPANDDVADATTIASSPFLDSIPRASALASTFEAGETYPSCLGDVNPQPHSVWYRIQPGADTQVTINVSSLTWVAVFDGASYPGATEVACMPENDTVFLGLQAGHTYLLQVGANPYGDTSVSVAMQLPPPNDDLGDALVVGAVPFADQVDLSFATSEPGEPGGCGYGGSLTAWYRFTPSVTGSVTVGTGGAYDAWAAVYTGSSLDALNQVTCEPGYASGATFAAHAGTTYLIQVGRAFGGLLDVSIQATPPPTAQLSFQPGTPSVFDSVGFTDSSSDPGGMTWSAAWTFGDGAGSTDANPSHQYARDGTYHVTLTIATTDGRTASTSADVVVQTHDVSIRKLTAPSSASAGQTKQVTVGVTDSRYPEPVRVDLWVSSPSGYAYAGSLFGTVTVRGANRTTDFVFSYAFTPSDAKARKVTFKAIVTTLSANDALPADNEATVTTRVAK